MCLSQEKPQGRGQTPRNRGRELWGSDGIGTLKGPGDERLWGRRGDRTQRQAEGPPSTRRQA